MEDWRRGFGGFLCPNFPLVWLMAGESALSGLHLWPVNEAVLAATVTWQTNPGREWTRVECAADLHPGASFDGPARLPLLPSNRSRGQNAKSDIWRLFAFNLVADCLGSVARWILN